VASSGSTSDFPEMSVIEERTEGREKRYFKVSSLTWWGGGVHEGNLFIRQIHEQKKTSMKKEGGGGGGGGGVGT
jgi:hypothetical protein